MTRSARRKKQGIPAWICVGFAASAIIWLPPLVLVGPPVIGVKKLWRKYGPIKHNIEPAPLPKPSRRQRPVNLDCQMSSQPVIGAAAPECGFWKLPLEIREQIWEEVLLPKGTLYVRRARGSNRLVELGTPDAPPPCYPFDKRGLDLALMKADKRFYREGTDFLYSSYRFHIFQSNTLTSFARTVPQPHYAQIRHLDFVIWHLSFVPGSDQQRRVTWRAKPWKRACRQLQKFTGLRTLKVTIRIGGLNGSLLSRRRGAYNDYIGVQDWHGLQGDRCRKKVLAPLLDPLTQVKPRDEFVVEYPWPEDMCNTWPGATFEMRHVDVVIDDKFPWPF